MHRPRASPRLALRYDPSPERSDPTAVAALYHQILAHAVLAEARGVDLVWVSERPFTEGTRLPAALPLCAAIVARTTRLRVGAGPLALPVHQPLRIAEDAATLDGLSGGRFELAIGLGADAVALAGFGIPGGARAVRLEEGVALLRAAWGGEPVEFEGQHHKVSGVTVYPRPVQPGGPPLWIGAGALAAVRRTARLGAGLLATEARAIAAFRAEAGPRAPASLELDAAEALAGDAPARLRAARDAVGGFDLVVGVETVAGILDAEGIDALVALRGSLGKG